MLSNTPTTSKRQNSVAELVIVLGLAFGQFILVSLQSFFYRVFQIPGAEQPIVFTDELFINLIGYEIVVGLLCCTILAARGWTLSDFHLRPSWKLTAVGFLLVAADYALYNTSHFLAGLVFGVQMLESVQFEYHVSLGIAALLSIVNPLFEELFVVGYAIPVVEGLSNVRVAIAFSTILRLIYHLYQGPMAFVRILPMGLIFALVYCRWRKLWPLLVAHAALDFLPLTFG
ncbi:hypothetical protein C1752_03958 [Acaryochloris thomasi RCC1774]|uniref:CAAX prenyl protease 2/Lysostaphin resistance protein A-like domain-containing protein n=1 Tax=Acaryochloris thomasi RCC1774 TaxID=1764569 RepID=A0A2W1JMI4_9CYAN|nr:CPBP family intramembrane glutamic endopeptidase [Acaryochloris thomasi]PZD72092.1 hypothetical protein C1752_03958 [Acaryochloris thomasi RCC1774]